MTLKKLSQAILLVSGIGLAASAQAGNIFITGHDSDEHNNGEYMAAGMDYLLFGTASNAGDRGSKSIAYVRTSSSYTVSDLSAMGYGVDLYTTNDLATVFAGGYDAIMIASGNGGASTANANLVSASADFASYFNNGGSLYINTDQGFGQTWYDFIPSFGTTVNNTIATSGIFVPTAAGLDIGLTNAIVDADITHSYFTSVDTSLFTVLEVTDTNAAQYNIPVGLPVAFGLREGSIGGGGFQGGTQVPEPASLLLMGVALAGLGVARRRKAS